MIRLCALAARRLWRVPKSTAQKLTAKEKKRKVQITVLWSTHGSSWVLYPLVTIAICLPHWNQRSTLLFAIDQNLSPLVFVGVTLCLITLVLPRQSSRTRFDFLARCVHSAVARLS